MQSEDCLDAKSIEGFRDEMTDIAEAMPWEIRS